MSDKLGNIDVALMNLERQYIKHKEKFDKWKVDNIKQRGSETYNTYVDRFHQWERGVKEQQRQLIGERNNLASSSDVDVALDSLLTRVSLKDFKLAVVTMTRKDTTFFPALLSTFKTVKANGDTRQPVYRQPYPSTAYAQSAVPSYTPQYASPSIAAVPTAHPYGAVRQETSVGNGALKRQFGESSPSTVTVPSNGVSKGDESGRKTFRAPSPVKDYRNPSTLAFRDFSQT